MKNLADLKTTFSNDSEISSFPSGIDTKSKLFENIEKWVEVQKKIKDLEKENSETQKEIFKQFAEREEKYRCSITQDPYFAILCVMTAAIGKEEEKSNS